MTDQPLAEEMQELSSAEEFLDYFNVAYEQKIVSVNRLHILQRFHDYISEKWQEMPEVDDEAAMYAIYQKLLTRAYQDFVESNPATEKVFKVFQAQEPQTTFVPVDQILES